MGGFVFSHTPIMLGQCIDGLDIKGDGIYVDCTVGGAGHSIHIAKRLTSGRLIAIDRDRDALEAASKRLADYADKVSFVHSNYSEIKGVLASFGINKVDGILADLGVSSYQLDNAERGFSYMNDAPLDMRMDRSSELNAYTVVNEYPKEKLKDILYKYGEEKRAPLIAAAIERERAKAPIETTLQLVNVIKGAVPKKDLEGAHHPAKRSFQAIRIEVNSELALLENAVGDMVDCLAESGRIAIITFHSLEDRIVKSVFSARAKGCTCPPDFPICVCGKTPELKTVGKTPIVPEKDELEANPRSRSAKLRVAKKIK